MRRSIAVAWNAALLAGVLAGTIAAGCGTGSIGGHDPLGGPGGGGERPEALVDSTKFPRLSHAQWENTVQDLLRLPAKSGLSATFTTDPPGSSFANNGELLRMTPGLWADYEAAAVKLAAPLTADATARGRIVPAGLTGDDTAKAKGFVTAFGKRAFRRPLTDQEQSEYVAFFLAAKATTGESDGFVAGVRLTVQAMLQAPAFVYRVEVGEPQPDGTIRLTAWELASKLSYALWGTMPDDALFAAAENGSILTPEGLEKQARRLLADPRATGAIDEFHHSLLQLDHIATATKDATLYPAWKPTVPAAMQAETRLFVRDVVLTREAGLAELLTSSETFVNADLAAVYGVSGTFGAEHVKVRLDPSQRAGFLTQGSFLAANSGPRDTDPIHRGVFTNLNVICADLPPPPMMVPPLPKDPEGKRTMRERVNAHTGPGTCGAGCHGTMINPIGFAFESFDASGRWRTTDNTLPIDTKATYQFADGPQTYDGPVALAKTLAARPQVHGCYVEKWLEYAYGRFPADGDGGLVDRVARKSLAGGSVKDLLVTLVLAPSFSRRPAGGS
jgi:hypothetical protein